MHIFTNIRSFENNYKDIKHLSEQDKINLDNFFREGGIIKTTGKTKLEILYPTKEIIQKELEKLTAERSKLTEQIKRWQKMKKESEKFIQKNKLTKYFKRLFWKHQIKALFDKNYKTDFEKTKIPIEFIGEESIEKIITEFINNNEYRQKLIETIESSIVYQNKGIGERILTKLTLQKEISQNKLDVLHTRKNKIDNKIKAYKLLLKWC